MSTNQDFFNMFLRKTPAFFADIIIAAFFFFLYDLSLIEAMGVGWGVVCTHMIVGAAIEGMYTSYIGHLLGHSLDLKKVGGWALITGATDGIGLAYAEALAARKINLVLVSRTQAKLEKVAADLKAAHDVDVEIVCTDFTKGPEIYPIIESELKAMGMEINILINNVGLSYPNPEYFLDLPNRDEFISDILNCNILSTLRMTAMLLPGMVSRGKGVVINLGSITCQIESPYMTLYGSTKAFLDKFTKDLVWEYGDKGITIQYQFPGYVTTKLSKFKMESFFIPSPEQYVEAALRSLGLQSRTPVWLPHKIASKMIEWGQFFRGSYTAESTKRILEEVWFYGKLVAMKKKRREEKMHVPVPVSDTESDKTL